MGFFSKIKEVLKRTKTAWSNKITELLSHGELDDNFYDELEEVLIMSDVGANCASEIVEKLREKVNKSKLRQQEDVKNALREALAEILDENERPMISYPLVYIVTGVNGVGKTTTIGKLANI